ncbi:hypothetical protein JXJ21_00900 [candidate division KSB1 bacterium]|nr:hypothetical protein [candidate division KSB1 bacterium]
MEEEQTLYMQQATTYQNSQDRTKKSGLMTGLSILGGSILAAVGGAIIYYVGTEACDRIMCIAPILMIGGGIGTVVGLIWTIINAIRPTKSIRCPQCNNEDRIYSSVKKYMCTECGTMLLLGSNKELDPQFSACAYCGLQTAVTEDHGQFLCPDCGFLRYSDGSEGDTSTQECPGCKKNVPASVIFCKYCNTILRADFSAPPVAAFGCEYDEDWKIGKSKSGHFQFARALLKSVREHLPLSEDILETQKLLDQVGQALISTEEASQDTSLREMIEKLMPEFDITYSGVIELELKQLRELPKKKKFKSDQLDTLLNEPFILARRRIEELFKESLEKGGGIGIWNEKLVTVTKDDSKSRVTNFIGLESEVQRFAAWKAALKGK